MNTPDNTAVLPLAAMPGRFSFHALLSMLHAAQPETTNSTRSGLVADNVYHLTSHSMQDDEGRLTNIYVADGLYSYEVGCHT